MKGKQQTQALRCNSDRWSQLVEICLNCFEKDMNKIEGEKGVAEKAYVEGWTSISELCLS